MGYLSLMRDVMAQAQLPLKRQCRPVLVGLMVAVKELQLDKDSIRGMVDNGELLWVFDVGLGNRERDLRFWLGELMEKCGTRNAERGTPHFAALSVEAAIEAIAGHPRDPELGTDTLWQILQLDRISIRRLILAGELQGRIQGHGWRITRASLVEFLSRRHIGARNAECGVRNHSSAECGMRNSKLRTPNSALDPLPTPNSPLRTSP